MKKFIISILCVAVFFIGLGGLIQETGARFKSNERALNLIKQSQIAIGGETAVRNVKSLSIVGSVTKNFDFDGTPRVEQGDLEINLQLPNQFSKMIKLRHEDGATNEKSGEVRKEVKVIVMNGDGDNASFSRQIEPSGQKQNVIIMRKAGGGNVVSNEKDADGKITKIIAENNVNIVKGEGNFHQNEMFRTVLTLLLSAPPETDFIYAGDMDVDGISCDVVEARNGNSSVKLFLDKSSHLPRMASFQGHKPIIFKIKSDEAKTETEARVFTTKLDKPEMTEFQIKFSDYRAVEGVLLPYRWTQTVGGNADETIDVTSFEINAANIAEKFQNLPPKVLIRTAKPQ